MRALTIILNFDRAARKVSFFTVYSGFGLLPLERFFWCGFSFLGLWMRSLWRKLVFVIFSCCWFFTISESLGLQFINFFWTMPSWNSKKGWFLIGLKEAKQTQNLGPIGWLTMGDEKRVILDRTWGCETNSKFRVYRMAYYGRWKKGDSWSDLRRRNKLKI